MAVLIALALFVAQAINFGLILNERSKARVLQAARPAAIRIADALDREVEGGRDLVADRGRVRRFPANPILPVVVKRDPELAAEVRRQLTEQGVTYRRVDTGQLNQSDQGTDRAGWKGARHYNRPAQMMIAVEQPDGRWVAVRAPWPQPGPRLLIALLTQTMILYGMILLPVIWIGRRMSRPLRDLASAARAFRPGEATAPVEERGPADVRAVIAAYNTLGTRVTAMLDEKDRMLGAIGHDLRTPLAALRVRIESVEDDDDRQRMADTVDEMARMLEDILSLARLGRSSEPPSEVDLAALVDAVAEDFRDLGHDVETRDADRLPWRVRPAMMRRAVRNLVENAIKYAGSAEVVVERRPDGACIAVLDRGPGIPEDRLAHVFEPFIRVETSRNRDTGGIGLGLALARAIVQEIGGTLTLTNRDGGGLAATITLPLPRN
ncbi:sensor histidine kinase [Sphingomonas sp. Leaf33]|uniref:sensor histidine kinase n=1 Tax=Sphingomonas sp. Leaf33 TaxID=1736215 RepID=UPI0009E664E0|nr:HAMP domain-containing sensor histidine kinase [Sphingomonas sp. Leaf33]